MGMLDRFLKRRRATTDAPASDPRELLVCEVERVLGEHEQVTAFERVTDDFALKVKSGEEETVLFLGNLFDETRELPPEERRERIVSFLDGLFGEEELEWSEAEPVLLPVIRACTYGVGPDPSGMVIPPRAARAFAPFLDATLVIDEPTKLHYVQRRRLAEWGVSEDGAFEAAIRNVAGTAGGALELYASTHGPVWHVPGEDVYAPSRLLLPGWLASMKDRVEGRPLAIIPERTMLFVAGDARPELVRWLAEKAQMEFEASRRSVSPAVYTVDDSGGVVPYLPAATGQTSSLVRTGHAMLLGVTYGEQKASLDPYFEKEGTDVFVATASLLRLDDGRVLSWCTWAEGVESLLPITDVVIAVGGSKKDGSEWQARVPFETARSIGGSTWANVELPMPPPRFRVAGPLSAEQKRALLAASRPLAECI